jgi:PAS domain S-box-containing protein
MHDMQGENEARQGPCEEVETLRERLRETEGVLDAIQRGRVDGILVSQPEGKKLYTFDGSDRIYRTIVERMNEGALVLRTDGAILSANLRFAEMVQLPLDRVFGAKLCDFLIEEDMNRCRRMLEENAADTKAEVLLQAGDGTTVPVLLSFSVLELESNLCLFAVVTDLTELKRKEEALQRAHDTLEQRVEQRTCELRSAVENLQREMAERERTQEALLEVENRLVEYSEQLEAMVEQRTRQVRGLERQRASMEQLAGAGRMAARVAHEINNPLAGIKNAFLLLKDAIPAEHKYAHYLPRVQTEIERIATIVRQMFELCRPPEENTERLSAGRILQDLSALHELACQKKSLVLELEISPVCGEAVVPAYALRQILHALIQNAIDASPPGGHVRVTADVAPEGMMRFTVSDGGPGISEERLPYIFEPFYTTKTTHREMGLGLGLSICRTLVEDACGTIMHRPKEGGGSTFIVTLPLASQVFAE